MKSIFCATIAGLLAVSHAEAATYNFQQAFQVSDGNNGEQINEIENFVILDGDVSRTRSASASDASVMTSFEIGRETGVLKLGASAEQDTGTRPQSVLTRLEIRERFTASGAGSVTFKLDMGGLLSAQTESAFALFEADMRIARYTGPSLGTAVEDDFSATLTMLGTQDTIRQEIDGVATDTVVATDDVLSGSLVVNPIFELTYDVFDTSVISLDIFLKTQTGLSNNTGNVEADFLNTAYLSFETTAGLTLSASDPLFLSTANGRPIGSVSPVPLPASIVLLVGGLFGFRFLGCRRS